MLRSYGRWRISRARDVRKAANSIFAGQAGVNRDERKKLRRASCQRRGFGRDQGDWGLTLGAAVRCGSDGR